MRLLVCGGRHFTAARTVDGWLDLVHWSCPVQVLIHGAARGVDTLAGEWAFARGVEVEPYPADWAGAGKTAGRERNARMLDVGMPNAVIAFPGGRGTKHMVKLAYAARVPVLDVGKMVVLDPPTFAAIAPWLARIMG